MPFSYFCNRKIHRTDEQNDASRLIISLQTLDIHSFLKNLKNNKHIYIYIRVSRSAISPDTMSQKELTGNVFKINLNKRCYSVTSLPVTARRSCDVLSINENQQVRKFMCAKQPVSSWNAMTSDIKPCLEGCCYRGFEWLPGRCYRVWGVVARTLL